MSASRFGASAGCYQGSAFCSVGQSLKKQIVGITNEFFCLLRSLGGQYFEENGIADVSFYGCLRYRRGYPNWH